MTQGPERLPASDKSSVPSVPSLLPADGRRASRSGCRQEVSLLRGPAAKAALADPLLLAQWQSLWTESPASTTFQAPGFVCAWYQAYARDWEPILLLSRSSPDQLRGLWTLAWNSRSGVLTHAGASQAEYHGWLASPSEGGRFVGAAWRALCAALPVAYLRFRYLPARELLEAVDSDPWLHERLRWRAVPRPLMRLDADEIRKSMAKKSNKSRMNRLKRLGELDFRRVTDAEELERVLPTLIGSYDFRQGAVNQTSPFREDVSKLDFHRAMFDAGEPTCHLTLTCLDGVPIAGFWGTVSGHMLHLGMLIHSPQLAEHSPGKLHLQQLAESLLDTGIDTIDLTPGGDAWKERFANAHDEVYELYLFAQPGQARAQDRRASIEAALKAGLRHLSLQPAQLRNAVAKLRRLRPQALASRIAGWVSERRELRIYRMAAGDVGERRHDPRVHANMIDALLAFEPGDSWQTRQGYLSAALARLEAGERAYTIAGDDGRLAHSGWLVPRQQQSRMSEVEQTLQLPPNSATLYDFYTDPANRGRGLYGATIDHILVDAFADPALEYAYISVLADNLASRKVIERAGFQYLGSFHWQRSLGRVRKFADACFEVPEEPDAPA
jgi:CelD/BcsL family acetyltransferase involved in cellulose biosynthesis